MNIMKVDFTSFFKRCFSVFSRDTKRREFDVILNTKTKYFSNYYKMNSLISLKVVSLLHKLHCLQYTIHKGWKPIYCLAKWDPFLKYFLTSIFNLIHHPTLLSRGCNRNIHSFLHSNKYHFLTAEKLALKDIPNQIIPGKESIGSKNIHTCQSTSAISFQIQLLWSQWQNYSQGEAETKCM